MAPDEPSGTVLLAGESTDQSKTETLRLFLRGVEGVVEGWPENSTYRSRDEVQGHLLSLSPAIDTEDPNDWPEDVIETLRRNGLLLRRLLEVLLDEVLVQAGRFPSESPPSEVINLLGTLQCLRRATLPEDAHAVARRLSEPDGFELLVEVAHDLRSPLTSITFLSETLRAGHSGKVNELQENQLGLIWSAAFGMTTVFSDLMDLARERANVSDEPAAPFSIRGVFEELEQMVAPMVEVKGLEIRFVGPVHDQVLGNEVALFRVLLNLTTNAIKFTEEGYVEVAAETLDRDRVGFWVRDTGRGIDEEAQKTLFQPFKKAGNRGGYFFSGSGLGLAIARRYVESMGSTLQIESGADQGTKFSFDLYLPPSARY